MHGLPPRADNPVYAQMDSLHKSCYGLFSELDLHHTLHENSSRPFSRDETTIAQTIQIQQSQIHTAHEEPES